MGTINKSVTINATADKVWNALANLDLLDKIDRAVKQTSVISSHSTGLDAARKVDMKDGKNWFKEKVSVWQPNEKLSFQLIDCTFPLTDLKYDYILKSTGNTTTVTQIMNYKMKFGILGKLMDALMVKKQFSKGVVLFHSDLKNYVESN